MTKLEAGASDGKLQWLTGRFVALGLGLQLLCCAISSLVLMIGLAGVAVYISPIAWLGAAALVLACLSYACKMWLDAKVLGEYAWALLWSLTAVLFVCPGIVVLSVWLLTPAAMFGIF